MKKVIAVGLAAWFAGTACVSAKAERPNMVWLVSEDNSADWLRLYNENFYLTK